MRFTLALFSMLCLGFAAHAESDQYEIGFDTAIGDQREFMSEELPQNKQEAKKFAEEHLAMLEDYYGHVGLKDLEAGYWDSWNLFFKTLPGK